jgi:putative flippase GtrA
MLAQIVRFGGVGGLATLAHVTVALAAQRGLPVSVQQANFMGFLAAVMLSYFGHARFTFQTRVGSAGQVQRFALMSLLGLATSSSTVWLVESALGLGFGAAMAVVAVVVPAVTFIAMRFWVFRRGQTETAGSWQSIAISALVALAMPLIFAGQPLTNDVVWYLIATREWLGGAPLYETIMEINPPLNFYYTVPPILLADHLGISDSNAQYLVVWVLLFVILCWCSAIIRADFGLTPSRQALLLLGVAVAMIVPAIDSIGQREFYLVVLMMPWLLGQVPARTPTTRAEVAAAAVAALGVCLKPHFVLFPLAVTIVRCVRSRSLRPVLSAANLTFLAVGLAYVGYVAIAHPAYLSEIVPIARLVYGAYSAEPMVVAGVVLREALLLSLPAVMALVDRDGRSDPYPFAAVSLAGLCSYLLQAKGFGYHMIPFLSFGLMACFLILLNSKRMGVFAVSSGVAAVGVIGVTVSMGFHHNLSADQIARVGKELGGFNSMMALTPHVYAGPPVAFETGTVWASRYPANWLVPGALNRLAKTDCSKEADLCASLAAIAAKNRSENIADMIAHKPDLLIVDRDSDYFDTPRFDWLAFMAEDPDWAGVIDDYQYAGQTKRYLYYLRNR